MAVTIGRIMMASTTEATKTEPLGSTLRLNRGIQPSLSASHSAAGARNGPSTMRPHRPKMIDGTAASRSTTKDTGPDARRCRYWVRHRATPTATGTAMTIASTEDRTVVQNKPAIPNRNWIVSGEQLRFGIAGLFWTTVLSSVLAMVMAVPVAVGVALCLTQYLHRRASGPVSFVVDLLAAVPSIIFGLWGLLVLGPFLAPAAEWLADKLGWIPLFSRSVDPKGSVFVASVVLAIMILPIITAISRDVFAQTPRDHIEAALALGATRWEVIRTAVLPHGRSGVISASMLGLGRALGETIAVMIILTQPAPGSPFTPSIFAGGETFASKIANNAQEFDTPSKTGAFIASGLVLFVVTFVVNAVARIIAERGQATS